MGFFHILNRGVDKRNVVLDDEDRFRFVYDLFEFNDQEPTLPNYGYFLNRGFITEYMDIGRPYIRQEQPHRKRKLLVHLHCFALMPNHYHLLLSPATEDGIPLFMKKLNMGYSKYFNEKYERSGTLWEGKYKSIHITKEAHFMHLPYYIHFNPLDLSFPQWRERRLKSAAKAVTFLKKYRWSSHLDYWGEENFPSVTQRNHMTEIFNEAGGYRKALHNELKDFSMEKVADIALE